MIGQMKQDEVTTTSPDAIVLDETELTWHIPAEKPKRTRRPSIDELNKLLMGADPRGLQVAAEENALRLIGRRSL